MKYADEVCQACDGFIEEVKERDRQLESAYRERAEVVAALARAAIALGYQAGFAHDPEEPEWPVLFIELPDVGQVWHFSAADAETLASDIGDYHGQWHDTEEKYERLRRWRP